MTVTLTNTGTAALTINSFAASGDFAATSTGASACPTSPATLAAGANCTINVTFTPTASGARTGTLSLADNAGGSPQIMTLSGNGTAPGVGLAPTSLGFGNQPLATTSTPMTVTLTNTGTAALTINSFAASGDFAATSTWASACPKSPATLAAGAHCTINVTFTPSALGARTGPLSLADDAGDSPFIITDTATAETSALALHPALPVFGNQPLATTSTPMTVTLTNTGAAALTINSFAPSGDFAATSTGASACPTSPATLAAGGTCTINRSEEHTSELQSRLHLVCRLLLEKKKNSTIQAGIHRPPPWFPASLKSDRFQIVIRYTCLSCLKCRYLSPEIRFFPHRSELLMCHV